MVVGGGGGGGGGGLDYREAMVGYCLSLQSPGTGFAWTYRTLQGPQDSARGRGQHHGGSGGEGWGGVGVDGGRVVG